MNHHFGMSEIPTLCRMKSGRSSLDFTQIFFLKRLRTLGNILYIIMWINFADLAVVTFRNKSRFILGIVPGKGYVHNLFNSVSIGFNGDMILVICPR